MSYAAIHLLSAAATLFVAVGDGAGPDRVGARIQRADHDVLQGTWVVVAYEFGSYTPRSRIGRLFVFNGDSVTYRYPDRREGDVTFSFSLDESKKLKQFELFRQRAKDRLHGRGIYSIQGDTLQWSYSWGTRPTKFGKTRGTFSFTLKRVDSNRQ